MGRRNKSDSVCVKDIKYVNKCGCTYIIIKFKVKCGVDKLKVGISPCKFTCMKDAQKTEMKYTCYDNCVKFKFKVCNICKNYIGYQYYKNCCKSNFTLLKVKY